MGVSIIVNDKILDAGGENTYAWGWNRILLNYEVLDFSKWGMKWFFYNTRFKPDNIMDEDDGMVTSENLKIGSEQMIQEIAEHLRISLDKNPVKARDQLRDILKSDKEKLLAVIRTLNSHVINDEIDTAWNYLREIRDPLEECEIEDGIPIDYKKSLAQHVRDVMRYVELAVFFYAVGTIGHTITWSY